MSPKQLARLAIALLVLLVLWGAAALARRSEGTGGTEKFSLPKIDTSAVDTVVVTSRYDTVVLARAGAGKWRVNGHAASAELVTRLLKALADTARPGELVAENASSHARLGVTADSGHRLRIAGRGRTLADFMAGRRTDDYRGFYLRRPNETAVYSVKSDLAEVLTRDEDEWRDRQIAAVKPDSVATIEVRNRNRSYTLQRKDKTWAFASGAPADSTAVADLLREFTDLQASGFATPEQADSADFTKPQRSTKLLSASGRPLASLVFDSTIGNFWVRHDSGGPVYRLDYWTTDRLTPADTALRRRP